MERLVTARRRPETVLEGQCPETVLEGHNLTNGAPGNGATAS